MSAQNDRVKSLEASVPVHRWHHPSQYTVFLVCSLSYLLPRSHEWSAGSLEVDAAKNRDEEEHTRTSIIITLSSIAIE